MFSLNFQSKIPIYEQLYKYILKMVSLGIMSENEQLPAVRSMAKDLGINPNTVQKAYQLLEQDGMIYSISGKGSFISPDAKTKDKKVQFATEKLNNLLLELYDIGVTKRECTLIIDDFFSNNTPSEH